MTEREEFEAWFKQLAIYKMRGEASLDLGHNGAYIDPMTGNMLLSWQAARASQWVSVDEPPKTQDHYLLWFGGDMFAVGWWDGIEWAPSGVEPTYDMSSLMFECGNTPVKYKAMEPPE
jgi:hypothetical protein